MNSKGQDISAGGIFMLAFFGLIFLALLVFGLPIYNVWNSEQGGKAELAKANYNRQIAIVEAEAKKTAAVSLADAEVERARGVAQANKIIGESLKGNEDYLKWLYISGLENNPNGRDVLYIPTEGSIPIILGGAIGK